MYLFPRMKHGLALHMAKVCCPFNRMKSAFHANIICLFGFVQDMCVCVCVVSQTAMCFSFSRRMLSFTRVF